MIPLPIDPLVPDLVASLRREPNLVLVAPPGAGKTTRVPRAMLDAGMADDREILVLQPRRLAARLAARRVADELGERVGERIGYQVRFEESASRATRVRFVTEGILTRRLLGDPKLASVGAVLLDEFHERHLHGDVGLALLRELQRRERPDLRIVAMSATLDAEPVARYLGEAPLFRSEGRRFDVAIEFAPQTDERPLSVQVASALRRLVDDGLDGDVLVFLPGAAEIRRAREACEPIASRADLLLVALHGDLSPAEQDRAVSPARQRKVILSTNVAETSVTIEGIVAVIDSGLARLASHAPWSGLPVLRVGRVSRASATQRAGRAGRLRAGRCVRLFTRHDFDTRPAHETPEIQRLDLAETVLELRAAGVRDPMRFPWFEPPPAGAVEAAETLLTRLDAIDASGAVTSIGRRMLRYPVHPRQARMIVEAQQRGVVQEGCAIAALIGEREVRTSARTRGFGGRGEEPDTTAGESDVVDALERFEDAAGVRFDMQRTRELGLEPAAVHAVERVRAQLARIAERDTAGVPDEPRDVALCKIVLAGYPDRVGRVRAPANATGRRGTEVVFAQGGSAQLAETSVVHRAEYVVAVDVEERIEPRGRQVIVRVASGIEPDWLLEMFTDHVKDATEVVFNPASGRVDAMRRMTYGSLVLDESPARDVDPDAIAKALADVAVSRGIRTLVDAEAFDRLLARVAFLRTHAPALAIPAFDDGLLRDAVRDAAAGSRTLNDLRDADLLGALRSRLTPAQARSLDELAPDRVQLPGGRRVRVEYPADAPPWIASRLQDFFGMAQGPALLGGRMPLVLHLLAPNQRAVQVTTDLAGFWTKHYPALARELRRKYPRHAWPDDPLHAAPPAPTRR